MLSNSKLLKMIGAFLVLLFVSFLLLFPVYATSWVSLEPAEVEKKSQIVVTGRYDTEKKFKQAGMWVPFDFKVDQYYKGFGSDVIRASIEGFDVGWATEHQKKGGSFLLFLEKHPTEKDLWIPVAGPNGMVLLLDGKVQALDSAKSPYYERYLAEKKGVAPVAAPVSAASGVSGVSVYVYGGVLVVLLAAVGVLVVRRRRV